MSLGHDHAHGKNFAREIVDLDPVLTLICL
jgi:hypothetical protein